MPQIRDYNSPIDTLRPADRGAEAFAQAGRREGAFFRQSGEDIAGGIRAVGNTVDTVAAHNEIAHGALGIAGLQADLTQKWNDAAKNADPNDPTVAARFQRDEVEPALEKFSGGFISDGGQRWAEGRIDALREHLATKTMADMSTLAGVAVTGNLDKIGNTYSGVAFSDPSSTKENLRQYDAAVGGLISTGNLDAAGVARVREHAEKVKEQIALSGLTGAINKNPNADYSKFAADPEIAPYLKGTDPKSVQQYQQSQKRISDSLDRAAQADQRRQQTDANDDALNKVFHDHTRVDANGNLAVDAGYFASIRDMATRPGLRPGLLNEMLNMGDHVAQNTGKVEDDPATKSALQKEIVDQDEDFLRHLVKAAADDKISGKTFTELHGMFSATQRDPEAVSSLKNVFNAARSTIVNPLMPGQKDAKGEQLYADFVNEIGPELAKMNAQQRREATDFSNPNSLVSKTLADPKYNRTPQQRLKDLMSAQGIGTPDPATDRAASIPATTPVTVKDPGDVAKLPPKTKFIIPSGPHKGEIGVAP